MESVFALAGKLAGELISPVFKTYIAEPWLHGSKDEFEKLKDTMFSIEVMLLDAEERQKTSNQIQHWLKEIKLAFYDVEDLLQEVTTEALKRQLKRKKRNWKSKVLRPFSSANTSTFRLKMGGKVKLIRERLDAISLDSKRFKFTERQSDDSRSKTRDETHSLVRAEKFIGRATDKKFVTKLLVESDVAENVSVVSVVGIGGMGKTTLAQSVYNSDEVKSKFELRMWVCVSDTFDVKLICENIIMSATKSRCERLPMEVVKEKLESSIDGRKYLLVLDDVWNEKEMEWEKLEVLLAGGARGSKILITARAELVARAARSNATHVLKGLSREDSWVLFKQIAFKRGVERVSPTMEGIGKEVLEKCVGVPLVVKAMGSILALKEKEIDWLNFKKYDLPRVTQDSEGTVLPILKLSYDYLSASLKRCFVYCAIYPKDHEIEKEELIGMWVAHGLIQLDGTTRSIEDVGERHFMDLLDRSFLEAQQTPDGTWYNMHDLIHDLAQSIGGDEYYNLGSGAKCMVKSTRHAWVSGDELTNICHDGEKLHTLVVSELDDEDNFNELTSSTFQQLRVLRMRNLWLTSVLQFVGGSRHLYYLDLSRSNLKSLSESICSLYNLQTLILSDCSKLEELPAGTRDLGSLRRLDISGCYNLRNMPRGLEELTCLQTLSDFVCQEEGGQRRNYAELCELKSLVNLRGSLEIRNLSGGSLANAKCETKRSCILVQLTLITELKLRWKYEKELKEEEEEAKLLLFESMKPHPNLERLIIEGYPGKKFPSWMDSRVYLPNIVFIKLDFCWRLRHLPALGLLPSLQKLYLKSNEGVEYLIDSRSIVEEEAEEPLFPSLKELYLDCIYQLKRVVESTESSRNKRYFPVMEKLVIDYCPLFLADGSSEDGKLFASVLELSFSSLDFPVHCGVSWIETETLPSGLQYLPHLQTLTLYRCCKIVSLPDWMGNLTSLQELNIRWLNSLASIPDCLQSLTSLQRLQIYGCTKIVSLPDWMGNLTSLQELHLDHLFSLASIPDCMQRLTSLQRLLIKDCRIELVRRCKKETGVDWHKIAHIPDITIEGADYLFHPESEESEDLSCPGEESE